jgi:hypothetical protein
MTFSATADGGELPLPSALCLARRRLSSAPPLTTEPIVSSFVTRLAKPTSTNKLYAGLIVSLHDSWPSPPVLTFFFPSLSPRNVVCLAEQHVEALKAGAGSKREEGSTRYVYCIHKRVQGPSDLGASTAALVALSREVHVTSER